MHRLELVGRKLFLAAAALPAEGLSIADQLGPMVSLALGRSSVLHAVVAVVLDLLSTSANCQTSQHCVSQKLLFAQPF